MDISDSESHAVTRVRRRDKLKGLLSHKVKVIDLKAGDHIYSWRWRAAGSYAHHGIYVGGEKEEVVHFNAKPLPTCSVCGEFRKGESGVIKSCLHRFMHEGSLYRYKYGVSKRVYFLNIRGGTCTIAISDDPETVIRRAMCLLDSNGFGKYHLLKKNCEDFALYCKTGKLILSDNNVVGCSSQIWSFIPLVSRYKWDIGVRRDVVNVEVEDLVAEFLRVNNGGEEVVNNSGD